MRGKRSRAITTSHQVCGNNTMFQLSCIERIPLPLRIVLWLLDAIQIVVPRTGEEELVDNVLCKVFG